MMREPKRIGLFGGSFDPVHNGHVMLADAALDELSLDTLYLIPAAQSPFKPDNRPVGGEARVKLLRLAFDGRENCEVDEQELCRGNASYTIDTVRDYAARYPDAEMTCLIGADHVPLLPQWREADELADLAAFAAVPRPGVVRIAFPIPFLGRWLRGTPVDVCASDIRTHVCKNQPIEHLVPSAVAEAIRELKLYAKQI